MQVYTKIIPIDFFYKLQRHEERQKLEGRRQEERQKLKRGRRQEEE